jgi:UDP-N-acetylglucosamine 4,6-dehydratase
MIDNKTILVTGGTGSFGRKFVEIALSRYDPKRIIIFSRDELKQHEMSIHHGDPRLSFFIGDIRDRDRLHRAFQANVDVIVHAAALKHVPACEYNPFEAVKTNVLGAQNVVDAAIDCGVPKVIALSTDKAVNPVNLYGATKLCAEKIIVQGNSYSGSRATRFSCVRYGNVIGSRGSVIPLFLKQKVSGSITVTDARMTRFWITLEEAVSLVVHGLTRMQGGEIFVPKMPSLRIVDLAKALAPDCEIEYIGIRPGEKLHEVLIMAEEARNTVVCDDLFVIMPPFPWWGKPRYRSSVPLPDGFIYGSETNDRWLTVREMREIVDESLSFHEESARQSESISQEKLIRFTQKEGKGRPSRAHKTP